MRPFAAFAIECTLVLFVVFFAIASNAFAYTMLTPISLKREVNYVDLSLRTITEYRRTPWEMLIESFKLIFLILPAISVLLILYLTLAVFVRGVNRTYNEHAKQHAIWRKEICAEVMASNEPIYYVKKAFTGSTWMFNCELPKGYRVYRHPNIYLAGITRLTHDEYQEQCAKEDLGHLGDSLV